MNSFTHTYFIRFFVMTYLLAGALLCAETKKNDLSKRLQLKADDITLVVGGKFKQEYFGGQNLTFLNSNVPYDVSSYVRTTADYFADIFYGEISRPRLMFHDTFRTRFRWGTTTEIKTFDGSINVAGASVKAKGLNVNKHLIWSRELWVRLALGNLDYPSNNFVQIGLVDFQVGRGISFGSAYSVEGFLGFSPGYSIDQFAPAVLLSLNPIVEAYTCDFYVALLENNHGSYSTNNEFIRLNEIGACPQRGLSRHSYVVAVRNKIKVLNGAKNKLNVEPYVVCQVAPDQDLEFTNDVDSFLTTYGCAVEAVHGRFNYGFEAAVNTGEHDIKPWDRNYVTIARNDQGFVTTQYTKVFIDDPSTTATPRPAAVTNANAAAVKGSAKDPNLNGQQIGTNLFNKIDITANPVTPTPYQNLYNAFDRFRPQQRQFLNGYFFVADASYEIIEKVLTGSLGVGYASGYIDPQRDVNKLTQTQLMNQQFTGFIPLQSAYQGTRLSHLVIFNVGVPRFNVKNPNTAVINTNLTQYLQPDGVNEMTNIAFFGSRFSWNVEALKAYKVNIAPNVIGYWSPETAQYLVTPKGVLPERTQFSNNYVGTEISAEFAAYFYERVKLEGYAGLILPGQHYKDLCGTPIKDQVSGSDIAYLVNIGLVYAF